MLVRPFIPGSMLMSMAVLIGASRKAYVQRFVGTPSEVTLLAIEFGEFLGSRHGNTRSCWRLQSAVRCATRCTP